MKEPKIGEEIRIRCVEGGCDKVGCCFNKLPTCPITICSEMYRADGKNVHFEIVEDNGCPSDETIMRVLNCIGYEERNWIEVVRKNWDKAMED